MDIGTLREAWRAKRVRIADLARAINRTPQTVHRYLSGEIDPPFSVAMLLMAEGKRLMAEKVDAAPITGTDGRPVGE